MDCSQWLIVLLQMLVLHSFILIQLIFKQSKNSHFLYEGIGRTADLAGAILIPTIVIYLTKAPTKKRMLTVAFYKLAQSLSICMIEENEEKCGKRNVEF